MTLRAFSAVAFPGSRWGTPPPEAPSWAAADMLSVEATASALPPPEAPQPVSAAVRARAAARAASRRGRKVVFIGVLSFGFFSPVYHKFRRRT